MRTSKSFTKYSLRVATLAAVAALALSSCGTADGNEATDQSDGELTTITVAEQSRAGLTAGGMIHLADNLGYFKEEGLAIDEYVVVTQGADAISGIMSGSVHFAHIGPEGFTAASQGGDVVGVAANTNASLWTVVAREDITDWSQLKGETIALGSTNDITRAVFDQLATEAGVDPDQDLEYVALGATPQRIAAVQEGQAAATIATYPAAARVIEDGLTDLGFAPDGVEVPQLMTTDIEASRKWVEEHPEEAAGYLRAIHRAIEFTKDPQNTDEVAEILHELNDEPIEHLKTAIETYYTDPEIEGLYFPTDFRHPEGTFDATIDAYQELGLFSGEITEEEYMDYTYAEMALEQ